MSVLGRMRKAVATALAANGPTDLTSIGFRVSNVLITPSIHTETKNLFSVAG
jgi:hypothetical protein